MDENNERLVAAGAVVGLIVGYAVGFVLLTIWFTGQPSRPGTVWPRVGVYSGITGLMTMISVALTVLRWRHVRDPVIDQTPRRFFDAPVGCWMGVAVGFVMTLFVCAWLGINGQSVLLAMFMAPLIGITTVVAYQVLDRLSLGWRK